MHTPTLASQSSPAFTEFRKRSLPPHIIESQKKEALAMVTEKESDDEQPQPAPLSFLERYFYKTTPFPGAIAGDSGSDAEPTRRFSLLSRGFITLAAFVSLIIIAVLCAVLATTLVRHKRLNQDLRRSPVREAIFANFADPVVVKHEDLFYAFATTNAAEFKKRKLTCPGILAQSNDTAALALGKSNVQMATSPNFKDWTLLNHTHDPLPQLGDWCRRGLTENLNPKANVWAPAVIKRPSDGKFVLYYSAAIENATRSSHCIGAALSESSSPAGPYLPLNATFACPVEEGGAIDPSPFIDTDNSFFVTYKVDGNNVGNGGSCGNMKAPQAPTPIKLQKMMADGVTPDGDAITILDRTEADGPLVEAPVIARSAEGTYFLFFSSGCTRDPSYDVKYAFAKDVRGPYERAKKPLLRTGDFNLTAPGSIGLTDMEDGTFGMVFHARVQASYGRVRAMYTTTIRFNGTEVLLVKKDW
ncbi:Arabinanase/levansucrase/invertase [Aureobasidium sp. EXF-10728]|nr:Arabinanase/levansucrase/invertase [Aureobasidium sp. EXF-10728]